MFEFNVYELGAIVACLIVMSYGFSVRRVANKGVVMTGKVLTAAAATGLLVTIFGWGVIRISMKLLSDFFITMF